ncbi:histone deacetylase [Methanofollis formosanus]|uniref:histone deacetylase n=1 Tax=Methanofollis formosanus TaxID=299308 RepID=A0A8G1A373_9EURY|nr:histone deacetylase [Methanofollis formosanus]QYZ79242.1 histone deacetylase [Methanofollis formosanus]
MRCAAVTGKVFARHDMEAYPGTPHAETGARLREVLTGLPPDVPVRPPVAADQAAIERVHDPAYVRWVVEMARGGRFLDANTYISPQGVQTAMMAAGAACIAVERALDGENTFALLRPPGHHAEPDRQMGFCIFNNVAVAAAQALEEEVDRVAILDWDLHHGNGTQKIFYSSEKALFCSVHQQESFPGTGWPEEIGAGRGKGCSLNAPIAPGCKLADYLHIFSEVFLPAIRAHRPDVLIVSAGQDGLADDPHGSMRLAPADYGHLTASLLSLDLPLALVLEGGYGPSHGKAVASIFAALKGREPALEEEGAPRRSTTLLAEKLKRLIYY